MANYVVLGLTIFNIIFIHKGCHGEMPSMQFQRHFNHLSQVRHPNFMDGEPWLEAREYIRDRFQEYGIERTDIQFQTFNTTISQAIGESSRIVEGANIIGISEGLDKSGPIIVVGADYDTPKLADPFRNNAGGVACLLETIHLFQDRIRWNTYVQNYTVIFVAFDLNTKEYLAANEGHSGSYFFVREWLDKYLLNGIREFMGAIILDSVSTFNTANNSQSLPAGFDLLFPEANEDIEQMGRKGDFLGLLYTKAGEDNPIRQSLVDNFNTSKRIRDNFRLQEMDVHLNFSSGSIQDTFEMFNHQAQYNFWTNPNKALPAFLLFDTDQYRDESSPYECTEDGCSVDEFLTEDRLRFMEKTTDTVLRTLLDLQTTELDSTRASSTTQHASAILLLLVAFTAYVIR